MRKSIMVTTFLVTGAGAVSAFASLPTTYQGSDTEFDLTTNAIAAAGLTPLTAYVGGGSGNAASAMTSNPPTQYTGPMSRMMKSEGNICSGFNSGTNGSTATAAESIVIGLDAVDVLSSNLAGTQTSCNGAAGTAGDGANNTGLAWSTLPSGVFSNAPTTSNPQTWKWVLAMVYGGLDLSNSSSVQDCNSAGRNALVNNWQQLFQTTCSFSSGAATCTDTNHGSQGPLWHAFRRDDVSGTSDVFSSILGLQNNPAPPGFPKTIEGGIDDNHYNGFGRTPYCNAMNWDASSGNSAACGNGDHMQWIGPGGIPDTTVDASGAHRKPPTGTWGNNPDPSKTSYSFDVLPTQFQDNDPIRRACLGGTTNNGARAGEEICNLDGKLGLVLPMPDSDWIAKVTIASPSSKAGSLAAQYPTLACTGFYNGTAPQVPTCPGRATKHSGECPNGDVGFAGGCQTPVNLVGTGTSQCVSSNSTNAPIQVRTNLGVAGGNLAGNPDGRIYNIHMRDGTASDNATMGYMQYAIPSLAGDPTEDFVGGYSRIHQVETVLPGVATNCQMVDMTDQIGCLAQADPCSIGYAGDGANTWASRATYVSGCTSANPSACPATGMGPMRIHTFAPGTTTVQKLGTTGEYELSRKLYFASFLGFQNIGADPVSGLTTASSELALANWETTTGPAPSMTALLVTDDFFDFGTQTVGGTSGIPFCEDFNEDNVCNGGFGAAGALGKTNTNACTATGSAGTGINSAIPNIANTANTICGNGTVEAYEECDNGANNGTAVGKCSLTCRCTTAFVQTSTSGDNGCQ